MTDREREPALANPSDPAPGQCVDVRLAVCVRLRVQHWLDLSVSVSLSVYPQECDGSTVELQHLDTQRTQETRLDSFWAVSTPRH